MAPSPRPPQSAIHPLDLAYQQAGVEVPAHRVITPDQIPAPYRDLLVHERDMTLTLEHHFGGPLRLRTLSTRVTGDWYLRRVLLVQEYSGRPVEMGAIRIRLDALRPKTRAQVLKHEEPLGRLLRAAGIDFLSRPRRYLAITPNQDLMGVFWMREPRLLYGRQTEVFQNGAKLGDIVEVLPLV